MHCFIWQNFVKGELKEKSGKLPEARAKRGQSAGKARDQVTCDFSLHLIGWGIGPLKDLSEDKALSDCFPLK